MAVHGLSKSRITAWRQCSKRLWLQIHRHELLEESDQAKRLYQIGNEVGEIAQRLCPDGILIKYQKNLVASIADTKAAMAAYPDRPIFEATFQHEGLLVQADVLLPTRKGFLSWRQRCSASMTAWWICCRWHASIITIQR